MSRHVNEIKDMLFDEPDFDSEDEEIKSKKIRRKKLKEEKKPSVETIVFHDRAKKRKISDVSRENFNCNQ